MPDHYDTSFWAKKVAGVQSDPLAISSAPPIVPPSVPPTQNLRGLPKSYQRFEEAGKPTASATAVKAITNLLNTMRTPTAKEASRLYTETGDPSGLMAIGFAPEAGILGGVRGAKMLEKLATKTEKSPFKQAILDAHRGVDAEKVWKETGWTKDPSGKWMFRIDDSGMKINKEVASKLTPGGQTKRLGNLIVWPDLFKAYPEMKTMIVYRTKKAGDGAAFKPKTGMIELEAGAGIESLKHELNHAVAKKEGFVKGGTSPSRTAEYAPVWDDVKKQWTHPSFKEARRQYTNTAGEIYAREEEVGFKGMPGTMEKIPHKDWIIRK